MYQSFLVKDCRSDVSPVINSDSYRHILVTNMGHSLRTILVFSYVYGAKLPFRGMPLIFVLRLNLRQNETKVITGHQV